MWVKRLVTFLIAAAFAVGLSGASFASSSGVVIKAKERSKMVPNQYIQDGKHYVQGTVRVKSGSTMTFTYADKETDPHTLTIVNKRDRPTNFAQVDNCKVCRRIGSAHLKNPKAPPGPKNPIVHWVLNKGKAGLNQVGDSVAIQEPGKHKSIKIKVSAKPGRRLLFMCLVHPWMQGKIIVKK